MSDSLSSIAFEFFLDGDDTTFTAPASDDVADTLDLSGVTLVPACAWCLQEAGLPLGNGSHGICAAHATSVRAGRKGGR